MAKIKAIRYRTPDQVPAGKHLVHSGGRYPVSMLSGQVPMLPGTHRSRWWLQASMAGIIECGCGWAPELGVHYRAADDPGPPPDLREIAATGTVSGIWRAEALSEIGFVFTCDEGTLTVLAEADVPGAEYLREGAAITLAWRGTGWHQDLAEVDAVRIAPAPGPAATS